MPSIFKTPKAPKMPKVPKVPKMPKAPKAPKMPKAPKTPKIPQAPKISAEAQSVKIAGPKMGFRVKSLLRVFRPLRWLILIAVAAALVYFFMPHKVNVWRYALNLNLYCLILLAVLTGILLIYVLIRLVRYFVELRRIKKQEELLGQAEMVRLREGFEGRWEHVLAFLKSSSVGVYELPLYLIGGGPDSAALTMLDSAAMTIPDTPETNALMYGQNILDRWIFTNDAIFIDTTGRTDTPSESGAEKVEWEVFLNLIAQKRRRCPINGMLVLTSASELANDSAEIRKTKAQMIQRRINYIQTFLKVRVPVYLIVVQMERIIGFSDYFCGLAREAREQIWGWSNPYPPDAAFGGYMFSEAFDALTSDLKKQRLMRISGDVAPEIANRAAMFPDEFASLAEPLGDYINVLFTENRFAEPALFRGFYFTSGNETGQLSTLHHKRYLPDNVLEAVTEAVAADISKKPLFIKDIFTRKVFMESGLIRRPRSIFRKNLKIKIIGALIVAALIVVGAYSLFNVAQNSELEVQKLEADVHAAEDVLQQKVKNADKLGLCIRLSSDRKRLNQKGAIARILGMGRFETLNNELGVIHRSIFQETTLQNIILKTEDRLNRWQGLRDKGDPRFNLFAEALDEYINWRNPSFGLNRSVNILPFLNFLQVPRKSKYQYEEQFNIYLDEGGRSRPMVSASADEIIRHASETARIYLRPSLEYLYGPSKNLAEAQWWLKLALHLQAIEDNYEGLLKLALPTEATSKAELTTAYSKFREYLNQVLTECQNIDQLMQTGRYNNVRWIDVNAFYDRLLESSRDMDVLETQLAKDKREVITDYTERVVIPIKRLASEINMLMEYPSQTWLADLLVKQFDADMIGLTPDFNIASKIYGLFNQAERYNDLIARVHSDLETWAARLPLQMSKLDYFKAPIRNTACGREKHALSIQLDALNELATKPIKTATPEGAPETQTDEDAELEERRKKIVAFWSLPDIISKMRQWSEVQRRVKMNTDSLYFEELLNRANFQQDIMAANSWYEIKALEIFRKGDGMALVTPIKSYLQNWVESMPLALRDLTKEGDEIKHYPELRAFTNKLKEMIILKDSFLPKLRVGAVDFAECIQAMPADVGAAWQILRDSAWSPGMIGPKVSWINLQSFSSFRKSLEMERGDVNQEILRQLTEIEFHVTDTFKRDLIGAYRNEKEQFFKKYNLANYGLKFPFRIDGPQISDAALLQFFEDLNKLAHHFELQEGFQQVGADGVKADIAPVAKRIVNELVDNEWMRFYEDSNALQNFLFKKGMVRVHKYTASLKPGAIGTYFHWLRINLGDSVIKDINVYGKPVIDLNMRAEDGSVTLHGLDAARMPQATALVTEGDHALLQMIYLYGKAMDAERMIWLVNLEIPLSINPSFAVKFAIKFVFSEGLPNLPVWPSLSQGKLTETDLKK